MYYNSDMRRVLLWIAACLFFAIFTTSIWYWFYLQYYRGESSGTLLPRANEHHNQRTQSGPVQQQGHPGPSVSSGHEIYELEIVQKDPGYKAGSEMDAARAVAVPPRSAARNDWGSYYPHQAPTDIIPSLKKEEDLGQSQNLAGDQNRLELATGGRRYYSATGSNPSRNPQMTPETGSRAAQTPDGQRTPLPRYTLEPCGADTPVYAESESSGHAARAFPRHPTP